MGNGQPDHRAVRQINGTLYQAFTERATTDNDATVLILDGSRDNLCGRGCIAVNQYYHLAVHEDTVTIRRIVCAGSPAPFRIDNQVIFLKELIRNIHGSLQIATAILLQVEDQMLHPLPLQFLQTLQKLLMGGGAKITDADKADFRTNHIHSIDGMDGDLVATDGK